MRDWNSFAESMTLFPDGAVQHECIPQAILGMDVICQAKSGMGKTAVFVLSVLQQLEPKDKEVAALIICHTRELAYQVRSLPDRSSSAVRPCHQRGLTLRSP